MLGAVLAASSFQQDVDYTSKKELSNNVTLVRWSYKCNSSRFILFLNSQGTFYDISGQSRFILRCPLDYPFLSILEVEFPDLPAKTFYQDAL